MKALLQWFNKLPLRSQIVINGVVVFLADTAIFLGLGYGPGWAIVTAVACGMGGGIGMAIRRERAQGRQQAQGARRQDA
jgi:uncharacterized membrane protein